MFRENEFSKLRVLKIANKDVYIVDRHQYVLPIWASKSIEKDESYDLVSIDYHPDTNPPFWQKAYFKAVNENREEDEVYIDEISRAMVAKIDREDASNMMHTSDDLNNDEHINTSMKLGYIRDYHMLNCMDNHLYERGNHYLIDESHFSSLEDDMFESVNFKVPSNKFILDIDLDYFLEKSSFNLIDENGHACELDIFRELVKKSEFITIARSIKYFNYLRREEFTIEECEEYMLDMIKKILI